MKPPQTEGNPSARAMEDANKRGATPLQPGTRSAGAWMGIRRRCRYGALPALFRTGPVLVALLAFLKTETGASAQSYSVDWITIGDGGGTSSGENFTLSGTLGQPDVTASTGGRYTVVGGFWTGLIVPSTNPAPTLFIRLSASDVVVSWAPAAGGFTLEQSFTLMPGSWTPAPSGASNPATIALGARPAFYRLRKP